MFLKGYARKVEDLLAEYKQVAGGKLMIEKYDPQPDSDAEDSARLDGIEPQALPGAERFYLGLAVKCADEGSPFRSWRPTASGCWNTTSPAPSSASRRRRSRSSAS